MRNRSPVEIIARRALEVMGNAALVPRGSDDASDDAGAPPGITTGTDGDGRTTRPFRLDSDPLDDDGYFLL